MVFGVTLFFALEQTRLESAVQHTGAVQRVRQNSRLTSDETCQTVRFCLSAVEEIFALSTRHAKKSKAKSRKSCIFYGCSPRSRESKIKNQKSKDKLADAFFTLRFVCQTQSVTTCWLARMVMNAPRSTCSDARSPFFFEA